MSRGKGVVNKKSIYEALKERDGLVCGVCGGLLEDEWKRYELWLSVPKNKLVKRKACEITIDHKIPKSKIRKQEGWKYTKGWWYADMGNLQLAHWTCNNKKGDETGPATARP